MIKFQVIGNLGKDCAINTVNGKTVMNFSVAHARENTGQNKDKEPIWVECSYWTERTGIAPYLKKGTQVFVDGQGDFRTYTKNDGTTGVSLTLRVNTVQLLGGGNRQEAEALDQSSTTGTPEETVTNVGGSSDDLPF